MNEMSARTRREERISLHHVRMQKDVSHLQTRKRALIRHEI